MKRKNIKEVNFPSTQIIHFVGGIKRTIPDVIYVWENEMTHLLTLQGTEWIINKNNVLCVEKPTTVGQSGQRSQPKQGSKSTDLSKEEDHG